MSKIATMSIAEDFTIKGTRKLCEEGLISDEVRKAIKVAIFTRAKQRNNLDPDVKIGYNGNSDAPNYLVIHEKGDETAVLEQGDDSDVELAQELANTQAELRAMREKVEALKTSMANLGL